jgi:hypothetical protein
MTDADTLWLQVLVARPTPPDAWLSFRAKSRNLLKLCLLQHVRTQVAPTRVQPVDENDFSSCATISSTGFPAIPFIIYQFCAPVIGSKAGMISFTVLPDSPRESIRDSDIENRVVPVCDDVDPKVIVARHGLIFASRDSSTSLGMT